LRAVELVKTNSKSITTPGIAADGLVTLAPEVLRVQVLQVDTKKISIDCQLFVTLSWVGAKKEKIVELKTISKLR
jgi:hypothetical protein